MSVNLEQPPGVQGNAPKNTRGNASWNSIVLVPAIARRGKAMQRIPWAQEFPGAPARVGGPQRRAPSFGGGPERGRARAGAGNGIGNGSRIGNGLRGKVRLQPPQPAVREAAERGPAVPALRRHYREEDRDQVSEGSAGPGCSSGAAPGAVAAAAPVASRRSIPPGAGLLNRRCKVNIYSRGEQSSQTRVGLAGR